jgi:hypothetical protein
MTADLTFFPAVMDDWADDWATCRSYISKALTLDKVNAYWKFTPHILSKDVTLSTFTIAHDGAKNT